MTKEVREVWTMAESGGLHPMEVRRGKHPKIICEEGMLVFAGTPSDHRNRANIRAQIRRLCRNRD